MQNLGRAVKIKNEEQKARSNTQNEVLVGQIKLSKEATNVPCIPCQQDKLRA